MDGEIGGGGRIGRRQLLEHYGRVQPRQAQSARLFRRVDAAEAEFAGLRQRVFREDRIGVPMRRVRRQFAGGESACRLLKGKLLLREFEIHRGPRVT